MNSSAQSFLAEGNLEKLSKEEYNAIKSQVTD